MLTLQPPAPKGESVHIFGFECGLPLSSWEENEQNIQLFFVNSHPQIHAYNFHFMKLLFTISFCLAFAGATYSQCWSLIFEEEFTGTSLDLNTWEYQVGSGGWGNNELQYYTNGNNVQVSNGTLKIIAQKSGNTYTSSRIRTINKADFRYGRIEARIKMPIGQGIWPAFWMMPTDDVYGGWPRSGEIDIVEYLGNEPNTIHGTCHYGNAYNDKGSSGSSYSLASGDFHTAFHVFSIEWEANVIRWYMDGQLYHAVSDSHPDFNNYTWPFIHDFHFILNLAVGGNWPGYPDASTVFPQTLEVDWVRVYQGFSAIEISGPTNLEPYTTAQTYSVADVSGASYNWSVPADAQIISGQGTSEIVVDLGSSAGDITVDVSSPCGVVSNSVYTDVISNQLLNYNFEEGNLYWLNNQYNGASANFNLDNTDAPEGSTAMCVDVLNSGNNFWDIQLGRADVSLVAGERYTLSFWAKAENNGSDLDISFIHPTNYSSYIYRNITLTDTWQQYTIEFISPITLNVLMNFDLGDEIGETCFDDFSLAKTALLSPHITGTRDCLVLWLTPDDNIHHLAGILDNYTIEILDANETVVVTHTNVGNSFTIDASQLTGLHFVRVINQNNGMVALQQIIKE